MDKTQLCDYEVHGNNPATSPPMGSLNPIGFKPLLYITLLLGF